MDRETGYRNIGAAIGSSPTSDALLAESARLARLYDAGLVALHVGKKTGEKEARNAEAAAETPRFTSRYLEGDPVKTLERAADEAEIDLLVFGALERESVIKHYAGSVARNLMRRASRSTLTLVDPKNRPGPFRSVCVSVEFDARGERALLIAADLAARERAERLCLVREVEAPGFAVAVQDAGSIAEAERVRGEWLRDEREKTRLFALEAGLRADKFDVVALFGGKGKEAAEFVKRADADLLVVPAPARKYGVLDRLFPHDVERLFEALPCSLLLVKSA
jgi:nucleotide-binding universal stress UspA family protein